MEVVEPSAVSLPPILNLNRNPNLNRFPDMKEIKITIKIKN